MSQHQQNPQYQPSLPPEPVKKRHALRNTVIVLSVGFIVFAGGCVAVLANGLNDATKETTATKAEVPAASSPATQPSATTSEAPASAEPTTTPTEEDRAAKVGATQWFEYSDGMKAQVTSLKRFRISQYAAGGKPGDVGVIVTVTLQNGSSNTFDTSLVDVKLASGPNGDQADPVFDSDQNLGGGFEGTILPGKKKTARYGFAIPKTHVSSTLELEVAPGWDYEGSHFEGKLSS
jgi:cytoskeletal protein RodZ